MDNDVIKPKARPAIHTVILEWFSKQSRGKVLDAPAGFGHLSMNLVEMGYEVSCGEIEPGIFKAPNCQCVYTDLNRKIDAPDKTFDYTCCVDGLEHMTDPYTAVKEFSRVLKDGGHGVFSIPNYSNMEKRFGFLMKGYLTKPKTYEDYLKSNSNLFNFHNSPLTITLLDLVFSVNHLRVDGIMADCVKTNQRLLLPLVWLMKGLAKIQSPKSRRKHRTDLTLDERVILGGNTLIFITTKVK